MAVEDIFRALDKQADEDCAAMLAHARAQSEKIIEEAKEQAAAMRTEKLAQVEREVNLERNKRLNQARLDGKKRASAERERLIQEVFVTAEQKVSKVRERADYQPVLERLLSEALSGVDAADAVVHADPRDEAAVKKAMAALAPNAGLSLDMNTTGGVKVTMADGKVQRVNTIESRLAKARRVVKWNVAAALFGS